MPSTLIVGAGMAGLTAARALAAEGIDVLVVDKGRAVGGRMATRRIGDAAFDHGAQHVSVRTDAFADEMQRLVDDGVTRVWLRTPSVAHPERGVEARYAGVGGMRRIPEALAAGLAVKTGTPVDRLEFAATDAIVLTPPAPQTMGILAANGLAVPDELVAIEYDATLAVMATLDEPADLPDGHVAPASGPVAWMADNQHKGVSAVPSLTIHSTAEFAAAHIDRDPEAWTKALLEAARPHHAGGVTDAVSHRWRFSQPHSTLGCGAMTVGAPIPVVLAGEVFAGARVEGAHISGLAAAEMVLDLLS